MPLPEDSFTHLIPELVKRLEEIGLTFENNEVKVDEQKLKEHRESLDRGSKS